MLTGIIVFALVFTACKKENETSKDKKFVTGEVIGPNGVKIKFMNYNLGAADNIKTMTPAQQAAHKTPADNYGDLYQWGRHTDGHEKRNSETVNGPFYGSKLDANGQPTGTYANEFITNGDITTNCDWRFPQKDDLWLSTSGIKTVNDPCPEGWRLPTNNEWQAVLDNNTTQWNNTGTRGRLITPKCESTPTLFLPAAGTRYNHDGSLSSAGTTGYYWSSSVKGTDAWDLRFASSDIGTTYRFSRAFGLSVRCVSEE